jgi:Zn-dependent protease
MFSKTELNQIFVSVVVLIFAFTLAFSDIVVYGFNIDVFTFFLLTSAIAVGSGFLLHELAHKICAQRLGCWAEYRYFQMGLILALLCSLFGFVFAAPGAVVIAGFMDRVTNGKVSAVGPATNLAIALFMLPVILLPALPPLAIIIAKITAKINIFLAGFNMIPVMPFDGAKVFAWDKRIFALILAGIICVGVVYFVPLL